MAELGVSKPSLQLLFRNYCSRKALGLRKPKFFHKLKQCFKIGQVRPLQFGGSTEICFSYLSTACIGIKCCYHEGAGENFIQQLRRHCRSYWIRCAAAVE